MKRRLLTLLPNAFFSPLIATPISAQQGLNGVLRYADGSPAPDVRVLFLYPGDITPSYPRICAATLSSPHIATQILPHISIDEDPLALMVEPRQAQRKKVPQTSASTWCPTARLP